MKTTDLTFREAAQALKEDKCEYIESERGNQCFMYAGIIQFRDYYGVREKPDRYDGKWHLRHLKFKWEVTCQDGSTYEVVSKKIKDGLKDALWTRTDITGIQRKESQ